MDLSGYHPTLKCAIAQPPTRSSNNCQCPPWLRAIIDLACVCQVRFRMYYGRSVLEASHRALRRSLTRYGTRPGAVVAMQHVLAHARSAHILLGTSTCDTGASLRLLPARHLGTCRARPAGENAADWPSWNRGARQVSLAHVFKRLRSGGWTRRRMPCRYLEVTKMN